MGTLTKNFNGGNEIYLHGTGNPGTAPTGTYDVDTVFPAGSTITFTACYVPTHQAQSGNNLPGMIAFWNEAIGTLQIKYGKNASDKTILNVSAGTTSSNPNSFYMANQRAYLTSDRTTTTKSVTTSSECNRLYVHIHNDNSDNYKLYLKASISCTTYTVSAVAYTNGSQSTTGGTVSVGTATVMSGNSSTVTATAKSGYAFTGWYSAASGGSKLSSDASYTITNITSDKTVYARFVSTYTVTLTRNITAAGSVSGDGTYNSGASVTVSATTNAGYTFVGWYNGDTQESSLESYTFTIGSNISLQARWVQNYTVTLTKNISEAGTVTGAGSYSSGTSVTVLATSNTNYTFLGWYKNNALQSESLSYTFTISEDISLEARWVYIEPGSKLLYGILVKATRVIQSN